MFDINRNNIKYNILEPINSRPLTSDRGKGKKSNKINLQIFQDMKESQFQLQKDVQNSKFIYLQVNSERKNQVVYLNPRNKSNSKNSSNKQIKQMQTLQSYRNVQKSCHNIRFRKMSFNIQSKQLKVPSTTKKTQKIGRPLSARIEDRKRIYQPSSSKIPTLTSKDIIFKKDTKFNSKQQIEQFQETTAFFIKKCIFVRVVKRKYQLQYEPVSNQYTVKIFGKLQIQNKNYFVVQNFNQTSIKELVSCFGPFKQQLVRKMIRDLVYGVTHCQFRVLIHSRLSPSTVFMSKQGKLLIDVIKASKKHPQKGQKIKNFHYFAPQILLQSKIQQSCDVWAIGCLTLYLLTGRLKTSPLHPYNKIIQQQSSHDQKKLKLIQQQMKNIVGIKNDQDYTISICQSAESNLSQEALLFINSCLQIQQKSRVNLRKIQFLDFLKVQSQYKYKN